MPHASHIRVMKQGWGLLRTACSRPRKKTSHHAFILKLSNIYPRCVMLFFVLIEGRGLDVYTYTDSKANGRVVSVAFKRLVVINRRLDGDRAAYKEGVT